jgi:hypothetical protein
LALLEVQGVSSLHDKAVPGLSIVKPLLVGEDNPYGKDPRYALYPLPENSAGGRLCSRIMQLSIKEYIKSFDRVNLCGEKWSLPEARDRALDLLIAQGEKRHDCFVLFGAKVSKAFNLKFEPFTVTTFNYSQDRTVSVAILPHPSGLNRMWEVPGNIERAREILLRVKAAAGFCDG